VEKRTASHFNFLTMCMPSIQYLRFICPIRLKLFSFQHSVDVSITTRSERAQKADHNLREIDEDKGTYLHTLISLEGSQTLKGRDQEARLTRIRSMLSHVMCPGRCGSVAVRLRIRKHG